MQCKTFTGAGFSAPRSWSLRFSQWSGFSGSSMRFLVEVLGGAAGFALIVAFSLMAVFSGWAWSQ